MIGIQVRRQLVSARTGDKRCEAKIVAHMQRQHRQRRVSSTIPLSSRFSIIGHCISDFSKDFVVSESVCVPF
jgi:hypothetical protein